MSSTLDSDFDGRRLAQVREAFFSAPSVTGVVRADVLESWQRSRQALGTPTAVSSVPHVGDEYLDEELVTMFAAPLARVSEGLADTDLGLVLADAHGRVLRRWFQDRTAAEHLDRLGTVRGAVLSEDSVGTNGLGTAAATGRVTQISGAEHFAEFYQQASCTGAPVRHPITGNLLAVITISTGVAANTHLLKPLVHSVAVQLEQHALDVQQPAARVLLDAFLEASRVHLQPVVAFGPQNIVMQSVTAATLAPTDIGILRQRSGDSRHRHTTRIPVELSVGQFDAHVTALGHGAGSIVVLERRRSYSAGGVAHSEFRLAGGSRSWATVVQRINQHVLKGTPVVVGGESGTGKTSAVMGRQFTPGAPMPRTVVDAAEHLTVGTAAWLQRVAGLISGTTPVVIRGIDALDGPLLTGLRALLQSEARQTAVLLTLAAESPIDTETVAGKLEVDHVWLPPLRDRSADIGPLWQQFVEKLTLGAAMQLSADALDVMTAYSWPGNVSELRSVAEKLHRAGKRGVVRPADLPAAVQGGRVLTMIERAELDALRYALDEAGGNRSKAAQILGLSRATVYRKMKAYRLGP
ncbi:helix-turn-helix domain-containing protein [Rhodococcus sp. IEGM 1366]|uniref:sigma-54-dependent Fis family transcriptional regulator n=1 Tax=Rhodococcus sp. IEGM 1366 TaxID=3082223 RepID=UPI002955B415|nr:helix-turn-helix domain-containing protein [Rhodococcus sp. IEGM 1366]MDV8070962.1 helix-turn-helix domain-containing protein [Rhodococcus sp. IEGM 1366]